MDQKNIQSTPGGKPVRPRSAQQPAPRPARAPHQPATQPPAAQQPTRLPPGPRPPQRPASITPRPANVVPMPPRALPPAQPDTIEANNRVIELPTRHEPVRHDVATPAHRPSRASRPMTALREVAQRYVGRLGSGPRATGAQAPVDVPAGDVCPHCSGVGYVRVDVPLGHPSFGRPQLCECRVREMEERKRAAEDAERDAVLTTSGLKAFETKTFENFDVTVPGVREAYEAALHLVSDPSGWLMLQGGYGCGKTHLAAAIANAREEAGDAVYFAIVPDLLDHLRAAFAPTAEISYDTLFERVRNASLLVLDDLGSENGTAWAAEKLFQIINHRYINHMSTVITTNSRLLTRADDRIRSRLADRDLVRPVVMEAADYRERYAGRPRRTTRGQGR